MRRLLSVTAAVVLALTAVPAPASAAVRAVDLGLLPGGDRSSAAAVDNAGTAVGYANTGTGLTHAVSWSRDNRITDLGTLPGDEESSADGISDSGVVYGHSYTGNGPLHAVRWVDHVIEALPPLPGHVESRAAAVNEAGTVVGVSANADRTEEHAVAWERSGRLVRLAELPGDPTSEAIDINRAGRIVGYSGGHGSVADLHPVVWAPDGSVTPLTFDGSNRGFAAGIDDAGVIAATVVDRDGRRHATRFRPGGQVDDLGADLRATGVGDDGTVLGYRSDRGRMHGCRWLPGTTAPEFLSLDFQIAAVSRRGVTVGATRGGGRVVHAMAWGRDGEDGTRLPTLGGVSGGAHDVNDHGVAVGSTEVPGGARHAVRWHL